MAKGSSENGFYFLRKMMAIILALDIGTSSTRAILYDDLGRCLQSQQYSIEQYYPKSGWVEHCPDEIWQKTLKATKEAISRAKINIKDIKACGITNQRETTVVWNKKNGQVLYKAIVWQDRRTENICHELTDEASFIHKKTGLILDAYY